MPALSSSLRGVAKLIVWAKSWDGLKLRVMVRHRGSSEALSSEFFLN